MGDVENLVNKSMSMAVAKVLKPQNAVAICISGMGVMAGCGSCFSSASEVLMCPPHRLDDRHLNASDLLASTNAASITLHGKSFRAVFCRRDGNTQAAGSM